MRKSLCHLLSVLVLCVVSYAQFTPQFVAYESITPYDNLSNCGTNGCFSPVANITGQTITQVAAAFDGTIWAITAAHKIYEHTPSTTSWVDESYNINGTAAQVTVASATSIYARTTSNGVRLFNFSTSNWDELPNGMTATDLSVGADGDLWAISTSTYNSCGKRLYHRTGSTWTATNFGGVQVSVGNANFVWFRCANKTVNSIDFGTHTASAVPGAIAAQITLSTDGSAYLIGADGATPFAYYSGRDGAPADDYGEGTCCWKLAGSMKYITDGSEMHTYFLDANGNMYYFPRIGFSTSATVEGTTVCNPGAACTMQSGTQHTAIATAQAPGNPQASQNTQSALWSSYLQVSASATSTPLQVAKAEDDFGGNTTTNQLVNATVSCPIAGMLVSEGYGSILSKYFKWAYTRTKWLGTQSNCTPNPLTTTCDFDVTDWCTPATTPPLHPVTVVRDGGYPLPTYAPTFWDGYDVCLSILGSPWECFPDSPALRTTANLPPANCTPLN